MVAIDFGIQGIEIERVLITRLCLGQTPSLLQHMAKLDPDARIARTKLQIDPIRRGGFAPSTRITMLIAGQPKRSGLRAKQMGRKTQTPRAPMPILPNGSIAVLCPLPVAINRRGVKQGTM